MSVQKSVVIIGAGIGGLATANLLAKAGYQVSVYEKNDQPGGRADTFSAKGFTFDMGPSWYLMPEVFEHFYELMDEDISTHLQLQRLSPAYKVFFEGNAQPVTITSDQDTDSATFESIEPGSGKNLQSYVSKGDIIYQLALKHFLYSNFTSLTDFLKKDVLAHGLTMLRLAFTPIDRYVGRFVRDVRLKQILEYPMVFLGTSPFKAPAIYSLMSALDFRQGVFYPQGGMYKIIESLVAIGTKNGVTYHYNSPTTRILTTSGTATGIELASGERIAADIVISNADLHHTETALLDQSDQSYPEKYWKKMQAGPSALLLYLGIKGSLPQLEHHNLLFVDDWKQNFEAIYDSRTYPDTASIYLCKPSGIDSSVAPDGHENVFVLVPSPPDRLLDANEQSQFVDQYLDQIALMTNTPDLKERIVFRRVFGPNDFADKLHSWQSTALGPSHVLSQSAFFRTPNKSKKVKNLYYAGGSTTPGIGLPMCLIGAELVYKRLAGDIKGGAVSQINPINQESQ
jgi:1-hydroxy-2-isopentenylcarotenoid 3,4-desaturase